MRVVPSGYRMGRVLTELDNPYAPPTSWSAETSANGGASGVKMAWLYWSWVGVFLVTLSTGTLLMSAAVATGLLLRIVTPARWWPAPAEEVS